MKKPLSFVSGFFYEISLFMKHTFQFFVSALLFFTACVQQKQKADPSTMVPSSVEDTYNTNTTILMLDERLNHIDSLVFVFYKDPLGNDSLRYTRFYTQYSTTETKDINILKNEINQPTERFEKVKKCRSQGKIWCFKKGEIFQTLYFSDFGGDCTFMFFIKNGQFYYCPLKTDFIETIRNLKLLSKEAK